VRAAQKYGEGGQRHAGVRTSLAVKEWSEWRVSKDSMNRAVLKSGESSTLMRCGARALKLGAAHRESWAEHEGTAACFFDGHQKEHAP
jgi:hypothetical protein